MTSRTFTKDEQAEAQARLRKMLKPGAEVKVIQRHVSSSGMQRRLSLFFVTAKGETLDITRDAAAAMGDRLQDDWTLKVTGCGMDMHFATVYGLSSALYRQGARCTGKRTCPSNDHSNDYGQAKRDFEALLEHQGRQWPDRSDEAAYQVLFAEMRAYIDQRLATDLGYDKSRVHSDGGYTLKHRTL